MLRRRGHAPRSALGRPQFNLPHYEDGGDRINYFSDKDGFIAAVRAVGGGTKSVSSDDYKITVATGEQAAQLDLVANRDSVCRKVQDEVWECEPLLSKEEESSMTEVPA
jgi:hypothetical protein